MAGKRKPCNSFCQLTLSLFIVCVAAVPAWAQTAAGRFVDHTFRDDAGEHKYVVFVPANYRSDKNSPAILFLHGAGERGTDNRLQLTEGLPPFIQARLGTFPFLVVIPQCDKSEARILNAWQAESPNGKRALLALEDAQKRYKVDPKRIVLTGWSMGGYGAWSLGMADPGRWSAVLPLAGGGDVSKVASLKDVPVWAFHGDLDNLVKVDDNRKMVDALTAAGGTVALTDLPNVGHYLCEYVYGNDAVIDWMLDPQKAPMKLGTKTVKAVPVVNVPFVPAVEIPQSAGVRLGNDALAALSYSIPANVPREMLTGQLNDMFDSTVAQGRSFAIRFSGISYSGTLERVLVRGNGPGRILVQLGIRNITLSIAGTSVTGQSHAAQAGQINIGIGHNYPVWLSLELAPSIADRQIRLTSLGASFQIPNDNWYVTQPAGISVQGFGMTQEAVSSGLTQGLYGAKGRIENEVLAVVPNIVKQLERNLVIPDSSSPLSQSGSSISKLWPLPIYAPRVRVWPEQIATDENGISLIVGMTAASLDPYGPAKPLKRVAAAGVNLNSLPNDKSLHAVVPPSILGTLTEMAVAADQLRLDLLDIPEPQFTKLADRETLQDLIPDLKRFGDQLQVRSTLRVLKPMEVIPPTQSADGPERPPFEFRANDLQVTLDIKTDPAQSKWQPCAVFNFDVAEQIQGRLDKPAHDLRIVTLAWLPNTSVTGTGKFADGYMPKEMTMDLDRYVSMFKQAWKTYTEGATSITVDVPDLNMGVSRMRLTDVRWKGSLVDVTYDLARIKITNLSNEPFTYETKAPTSSWGAPLTLKPGDSHEFSIPYPLTYRRSTSSGQEVYTLLTGSHSEYRVPVAGGAPRLFAAKRSTTTTQ